MGISSPGAATPLMTPPGAQPGNLPGAGNRPGNMVAGANPLAKPPNQIPMFNASGLHATGCVCCSSPGGMLNLDQLRTVTSAIDNEIRAHEAAHLAGLGSVGGQLSLQYQTIGPFTFAVAGSVDFTMPKLDALNPEISRNLFQQVMAGALAPADPSGQDVAVAAQASQMLSMANQAVSEKNANRGNPQGNPNPFQFGLNVFG